MNDKWVLYKHTFPNGKVYIGITSQNIRDRWGKEGGGYNGQPIMERAIKKYGWKNGKHEIVLENLSKEEVKQKEFEYIEKYHSYYKDPLGPGYNMTKGGEGVVLTDWNLFLKLYKEGKNFSEISQITGCSRNAISNAIHKLEPDITNYYVKKINQFDLKGNYIKTYDSCADAGRELKVAASAIRLTVRGLAKSAYNFQWRFYNLQDINNGIGSIQREQGKRVPKYKKVAQYDKNNNLIKIYNNSKEAAKENNVKYGVIKDSLRQRTQYCCNRQYYFRYIEEGQES